MTTKIDQNSQHLSVAALLLAAGTSSRTGSINKLFINHKGRPLLEHIVNTLTMAAFDEILAVTGHQGARVETFLTKRHIPSVRNEQFKTGIASSVSLGLSRLDHHAGVMIFPADMPNISVSAIEILRKNFERSATATPSPKIFIPNFNNTRGNPVLLSKPIFPAVMSLKGDSGARQLFDQLGDSVLDVETKCPGVLKDFDELLDFEP